MIIAQNKRKENIAEYLLYMWQVEDIMRAYGLDINKIKASIIDRYDVDDNTRKAITDWWEGLIMMMQHEGKKKQGTFKSIRMYLSGLPIYTMSCCKALNILNMELSSTKHFRL